MCLGTLQSFFYFFFFAVSRFLHLCYICFVTPYTPKVPHFSHTPPAEPFSWPVREFRTSCLKSPLQSIPATHSSHCPWPVHFTIHYRAVTDRWLSLWQVRWHCIEVRSRFHVLAMYLWSYEFSAAHLSEQQLSRKNADERADSADALMWVWCKGKNKRIKKKTDTHRLLLLVSFWLHVFETLHIKTENQLLLFGCQHNSTITLYLCVV